MTEFKLKHQNITRCYQHAIFFSTQRGCQTEEEFKMDFLTFCHWLQSTGWATWVRQSSFAFPALYVVHIFGFILLSRRYSGTGWTDAGLVGTIGVRVSCFESNSSVGQSGFCPKPSTGVILFSAGAVNMYTNTAFRVKILMVIGAGLNILLFHKTSYRHVEEWGNQGVTPTSAKVTAIVSLFLWFGIVAMSRVIGFTGAQE